MKSFLMVAALLAGLAAPALADDATTAQPPPPQPETQAALSPSQEGSVPAALPQSKPVQVVPMSTMLDSNGPPPARGGGCHHDGEQVYLTN
jgi:hypothetical protein